MIGYVKLEVSLMGSSLEGGPKPDENRDRSIEKNIFMPDIYQPTVEQDMAKYSIRIHKADGLPQMDGGMAKLFGKRRFFKQPSNRILSQREMSKIKAHTITRFMIKKILFKIYEILTHCLMVLISK